MLGQGDHQHDRQYHHAKVAQATVGSLSELGLPFEMTLGDAAG